MSEQKQSWQSEYQKLLRETDEWFTQRDEKVAVSIERSERILRLLRWIALNPFATWVIYPLIAVVLILSYVFYSVAVLAHLPVSALVLSDIHQTVVVCSLALFAWCLLVPLRIFFEVTTKTPLSMLPSGYLLAWLIAIGSEIAVSGLFGDVAAVCASWGIIVSFAACLFIYAEHYDLQKELEGYTLKFTEKLEAIKDLPDDPSALEEDTEGKCTICLKESIYDVCLACEQRFRGERHRVRAQNLRAKQHGVPATLTLKEWLDTLENFHWRCAYCSGKYEVMEHYIPVTQGGGTTAENCVPGCYKCNSKKSDSHPEQVRKPRRRHNQ